MSALSRLEIAVEPIVLGLRATQEELTSVGQRVDWEVWVELMERLESTLGGPSELEQFALLAISAPHVRQFQRLAQLFSSPLSLYRFHCRWGVPSQYRNMCSTCDEQAGGRLAVMLSIPETYRGSVSTFRVGAGVLRGLPTLIGLSESRVILEEVSPHHARLILEPPRSRTLLSQARELTRKARGQESLVASSGVQEVAVASKRLIQEQRLDPDKSVEAAPQSSMGRWRALAENAPGVIVLLSPDGRITAISRAFHGIEPAAMLGQELCDLFEPTERAQLSAAIARVKAEPSVCEVQLSVFDANAIQAWYCCRLEPMGSTTDDFALSAFLTDITSGVRAEQHLRQREAELSRVQRMEALGFLAGGVAHDFNNLLTVILGVADLLLEDPRTADEQKQELSHIYRAGERAAEITRELLTFSRQQVVEPRVMNLEPAIKDFEGILQRVVGEEIYLDIRTAAPLWNVKLDPGQVDQILINLAVNAREAMPRGGTFTVLTKNVELDAPALTGGAFVNAGAYVELCVRDTGRGMSNETIGRIFEPFFSTRKQGTGTGLGLAIVRRAVIDSGGHLWVESELGHGTSFRLWFPRSQQLGFSAAPPRRLSSGVGRETILLVEDDVDVRMLASKTLTDRGYRVIECAGGDEALGRGDPFDLVLVDVMMSDINGPELADLLSASRPELAVLFMSGHAEQELIERGVLDAGEALLCKPFGPETLANRVRQVLDQKNLSQRQVN